VQNLFNFEFFGEKIWLQLAKYWVFELFAWVFQKFLSFSKILVFFKNSWVFQKFLSFFGMSNKKPAVTTNFGTRNENLKTANYNCKLEKNCTWIPQKPSICAATLISVRGLFLTGFHDNSLLPYTHVVFHVASYQDVKKEIFSFEKCIYLQYVAYDVLFMCPPPFQSPH